MRHVIVCVECGATSASPSVRGWRGCRIDEEELNESPTLAFYCPVCSEAEFGGSSARASVPGRRWRDADRPGVLVFRVVLAAAPPAAGEEGFGSGLDAIAAIGGSDVRLSDGDDGAARVEFDLAAQNEGHARRLALGLLADQAGAGRNGWVIVSLDPGY